MHKVYETADTEERDADLAEMMRWSEIRTICGVCI
jgi:hypothetical protein